MGSEKPKVHWNDKESTELKGQWVLSSIFGKDCNNDKGQGIRDVPSACCDWSLGVGSRQNFIYIGHTLVGFLPVEYKEDCITVRGVKEWWRGRNTAITKHRNWGL